MAAPGAVRDLCEEATCSVCLEYFKDPVTIVECGHNFCRACLTQCCGEPDTEAFCPQCRETVQQSKFIPNRQLKSVVEIAKKLSLQGGNKTEGEERVCEKHREPLKLFCKDHESSICVVCDRSKEHENHKVIPLEEAYEEYKDQICSLIKTLRKKEEKMLAYKGDIEKKSQDLLEQTKADKQKTRAEFRQLHQFLEEQEKRLLAQMEELEKEIAIKRDAHLATVSKELSSLASFIQEMEEKRQQPASELLQDVRRTLERCETEKTYDKKNPVAFPPALKWRIWDFSDISAFLEGVMKQFQDTLVSGLPLQKANVILDPDTANPRLIMSEDPKSLTCGEKYQDLPQNPERFDCWPCVLGCEGYSAGRHSWEVAVGGEGDWAVGVASKSVKRKGCFELGPEEGIWAVGKLGGQYRAFTSPKWTPLSLCGALKRVRVSLDCAGPRLTFSDADTAAPLYAFSGASFTRGTVCPFFLVYRNSLLTLSL
ncbi:E3 ubiquitin-protein ligase TRIM7-like [Hemicordylus capensis]|uniref:E3 ubiquitin-protein ligase TRIM7-like n=1 Tax=Hemicordylus capensis TaxID=884348 RepID=UPI002303BB26|nr:E3 ubiquitin-protein ligase TRIM7-like [Hemicordylus capensis]